MMLTGGGSPGPIGHPADRHSPDRDHRGGRRPGALRAAVAAGQAGAAMRGSAAMALRKGED